METPQLVGQNSYCHGWGPQKVAKNFFGRSRHIGNRQHDNVQNERSLGQIYPS